MEKPKNENRKILTRTGLSTSLLLNKTALDAYNKKTQELRDAATVLDSEGVLYVIMSDKKDKFSKDSKIIRDILDLDHMYSRENMQRKPELATEYAEIYNLIKEISKKVEKRRKSQKRR